MTPFKIRHAKASDLPFLYSTWTHNFRYDGDQPKTRNSIFYPAYQRVIDHILSRPNTKVFVAVDPESDTILSYLVCEPMVLHYLFTKDSMRELGLARALFTHAFGDARNAVTYTHRTKYVKAMLKAHDHLTFNPYTHLYKLKENDDV